MKSRSFQDFVTTPTSCYGGNNSHRHVPPAKVNIKADWLSVMCSIHISLFTPPDDLWTYPILALCQCSLVKFQKFGGLRCQPPVDSTDTPFVCLSPLKHQRVNLLTLLDLQRYVYQFRIRDGTRTHTPCGTAPSTPPVYQFQHPDKTIDGIPLLRCRIRTASSENARDVHSDMLTTTPLPLGIDRKTIS